MRGMAYCAEVSGHGVSAIVQRDTESPGSDATSGTLSTPYPLPRILHAAIVGMAVMLFSALSLKNIALPGLYYDEALDVVPAMQLLQGMPLEPVRGAYLSVAGHPLPLMIMDYVGTVNTYLALPVFAVFGVNVTSVRLLPILLAALGLVLGYLVALRLFDWRVAAISVLLVAVDPSYVFFSRMGIHVTSVMNIFALGSLLALLHWRSSGQRRWLLIGGLLLGLGLWAKVLFLWWIVALAVHGLWTRAGHGLRTRIARIREHGLRVWLARIGEGIWNATAPVVANAAGHNGWPTVEVAVITAGILIGSAPLWVYNLTTGGTLTAFGRNAVVTEQGINNLNVIGNLIVAVDSFRILLDGSYFWFQGRQFANPLNVVGFAGAAAGTLLLIRRKPQWRPALVMIGTLIAVIVAESAFTVSGIWATHLYILLPLPQMVLAVAIVLLADWLAQRISLVQAEEQNAGGLRHRLSFLAPRSPKWRVLAQRAVMIIALAAGMTTNLGVDLAYHAAMVRSGGLSRFSDAIYKLADWLDAQHFDTVYAVDWGIQKNVQILTQGRVNPLEISGFGGESPAAFAQRAEKALMDPSRAVYVFHSKEDTVYELYPTFQAVADRLGVKLKIIEATRDRSGAPVHVMWVRQ